MARTKLGDLGVDERITLKWLRKEAGWTQLPQSNPVVAGIL
jgi:hypothetical protein